MRYLRPVLLLLFGTFAIEPLCAQSVPRLPTRNVRDYGAKGDGFADDTKAFLRALNEARGNPDGAKAPLNVYVPAGRYLLRDTLILWKATQLVGDWRNPPTLVLAPNTKGFGDWERPRPFLVTANGYRLREDSRDWHTRSNEVGGSTNNTFGVYLMDLNVEIGEGNAGAWGVYWLVAQQTAMRNVRINAGGAQGCIRSFFWGGGGVIANVTCEGGDYGWQVRETSQFLMRSCVFTGQRKASIAIADAWMFTFLDVQFRDTAPFQADGGMVALLECSFEKVQGATVLDMRNGTFLLENVRVDDPSQLPADLRNAMTTMGSVPIWASRSVGTERKERRRKASAESSQFSGRTVRNPVLPADEQRSGQYSRPWRNGRRNNRRYARHTKGSGRKQGDLFSNRELQSDRRIENSCGTTPLWRTWCKDLSLRRKPRIRRGVQKAFHSGSSSRDRRCDPARNDI